MALSSWLGAAATAHGDPRRGSGAHSQGCPSRWPWWARAGCERAHARAGNHPAGQDTKGGRAALTGQTRPHATLLHHGVSHKQQQQAHRRPAPSQLRRSTAAARARTTGLHRLRAAAAALLIVTRLQHRDWGWAASGVACASSESSCAALLDPVTSCEARPLITCLRFTM